MRVMKKLVVGAAAAATLLTAIPAHATGTVVWENRQARVTETLTPRTVCDIVDGQDYCYVVNDAVWKVQSKLARSVQVRVKCTFTWHAAERTGPPEQTLFFNFYVKKGEPQTHNWDRTAFTSDWNCFSRKVNSG
jgi:hypothetical protein